MKNKLHSSIKIAQQELSRSVISINTDAINESTEKKEDFLTFGIKNSSQIPHGVFEKLRRDPHYLWLTVDKMADKGRSIDTDLINPLTYRCMTGSSSGGAVNILKGINDFAVGTDGGGSVLAPALACQLTAMIGAGLELYVQGKGQSTDNLSIQGSIGVISKSLKMVKDVMSCLAEVSLSASNRRLRVMIPEEGTCILPDGVPMEEKLKPFLGGDDRFVFVNGDLEGISDRHVGLVKLKKAMKYIDLVLTYEGPIDVFGYGETIPKMFKGSTGHRITENDGKFAVKCANVCGMTGVVVPGTELAAGFVICAPHGTQGARDALSLAHMLENQVTLPEVFTRYYFNGERYKEAFQL